MRRSSIAAVVRGASVAALLGLATAISPLTAAVSHAATPEQVSGTPAAGTPRLPVSSTSTEQIRQLAPCGGEMYAVGTFPSVIGKNSQAFPRVDVFSFSQTAPYAVSAFSVDIQPLASGQTATVNTIALSSDCSDAYIGGKFSIAGSTAKNFAEVDTSTGDVVPGFKSQASGMVNTIVMAGSHLLVGGQFSDINDSSGTDPRPYFVSLSPTTGLDDDYFPMPTQSDPGIQLAGNYEYTDAAGKTTVSNATAVTNQQISPDGSRDLIEGDFMTIGGVSRQQVAMIDLGSTEATLDTWNAPEFNSYCNFVAPDYSQAAAWSPDGSTIFFASSGYKPSTGPGYDATHPTNSPRAGLCDSASSFPSTSTDPSGAVTHNWINYTGCDSLYSVATDGSNLYFAGHERWVDNANGCDGAGPGAIAAEGIDGLSPADGSLVADPTRARGLGADDMIFTDTGLWIASDNYNGSETCGDVPGHAGLCLLPYTSTVTEPGPFAAVPTVTGKLAVGSTLTCAEGTQPSDVTVAYSWLLAGAPVSSAATFTVPAKDYDQTLACQVTVSRTGSPSQTISTLATPVRAGPALKAEVAPELTHHPKVRHKVSARHGIWSPAAGSYTYQWYLNGKAIKGATTPSYTPTKHAKGKRLRCIVVAHRSGYANGRADTQGWKVEAA